MSASDSTGQQNILQNSSGLIGRAAIWHSVHWEILCSDKNTKGIGLLIAAERQVGKTAFTTALYKALKNTGRVCVQVPKISFSDGWQQILVKSFQKTEHPFSRAVQQNPDILTVQAAQKHIQRITRETGLPPLLIFDEAAPLARSAPNNELFLVLPELKQAGLSIVADAYTAGDKLRDFDQLGRGGLRPSNVNSVFDLVYHLDPWSIKLTRAYVAQYFSVNKISAPPEIAEAIVQISQGYPSSLIATTRNIAQALLENPNVEPRKILPRAVLHYNHNPYTESGASFLDLRQLNSPTLDIGIDFIKQCFFEMQFEAAEKMTFKPNAWSQPISFDLAELERRIEEKRLARGAIMSPDLIEDIRFDWRNRCENGHEKINAAIVKFPALRKVLDNEVLTNCETTQLVEMMNSTTTSFDDPLSFLGSQLGDLIQQCHIHPFRPLSKEKTVQRRHLLINFLLDMNIVERTAEGKYQFPGNQAPIAALLQENPDEFIRRLPKNVVQHNHSAVLASQTQLINPNLAEVWQRDLALA